MFAPPHLAFLDLGFQELFVIMVMALLLFGGRLPEVARSLGRTVGEFKRSANSMTREFRFDDTSFPSRRDLKSVQNKVKELAKDVTDAALPDAKKKTPEETDQPSKSDQSAGKTPPAAGSVARAFDRADPLPDDDSETPRQEEKPTSKLS